MTTSIDQIHRDHTWRFISANPLNLVFTRRVKVVSHGSWAWTDDNPTLLPAQWVRFVTQRQPLSIVSPEGRAFATRQVLIGMPELDVEVGDLATIGNGYYEVRQVDRNPWWRTEAELYQHV